MSPNNRFISSSKFDFSCSSVILLLIRVVDAVPNAIAVGNNAAAAAAPTARVRSERKNTAPATAATLQNIKL